MAKKRTKVSVPKRLAGVKIPKAVRRGLKDLAASQSGKAVITEALMAAGAALAASQVPPRSKTRQAIRKKAPAAKAAGHKAAASVSESRAAVGDAFEEATRSFTDVLRRRSAGEAAGATSAPKMAEEPAGVTH